LCRTCMGPEAEDLPAPPDDHQLTTADAAELADIAAIYETPTRGRRP
jgi:hypothetical protein